MPYGALMYVVLLHCCWCGQVLLRACSLLPPHFGACTLAAVLHSEQQHDSRHGCSAAVWLPVDTTAACLDLLLKYAVNKGAAAVWAQQLGSMDTTGALAALFKAALVLDSQARAIDYTVAGQRLAHAIAFIKQQACMLSAAASMPDGDAMEVQRHEWHCAVAVSGLLQLQHSTARYAKAFEDTGGTRSTGGCD